MVFITISKYKYIFFTIALCCIILLIINQQKSISHSDIPIKGKICIIIDDFGNSENDLHRNFLTLPNDITISIIPGESYSEDISYMAYKYGFEIMVHMPMEAYDEKANFLNNYLLTSNLNYNQVYDKLENAFLEIPHALGINNHQGSKATENVQLMKNVARSLKSMDKYFIDSYTSPNSKGFITMRQNGVKTDVRQIFLDNIDHPDSIKKNLDKLVELSHSMDIAIAIGHVKENTYQVLDKEIPILKKKGYQFLRASEIVK